MSRGVTKTRVKTRSATSTKVPSKRPSKSQNLGSSSGDRIDGGPSPAKKAALKVKATLKTEGILIFSLCMKSEKYYLIVIPHLKGFFFSPRQNL